jgi:hypothetical protein
MSVDPETGGLGYLNRQLAPVADLANASMYPLYGFCLEGPGVGICPAWKQCCCGKQPSIKPDQTIQRPPR